MHRQRQPWHWLTERSSSSELHVAATPTVFWDPGLPHPNPEMFWPDQTWKKGDTATSTGTAKSQTPWGMWDMVPSLLHVSFSFPMLFLLFPIPLFCLIRDWLAGQDCTFCSTVVNLWPEKQLNAMPRVSEWLIRLGAVSVFFQQQDCKWKWTAETEAVFSVFAFLSSYFPFCVFVLSSKKWHQILTTAPDSLN